MRGTMSALALFLSLLFAAPAAKPAAPAAPSDLPAPPAGYSWTRMPAVHAAFLTPKGWHVRREQKDDMLVLLMTKEELPKEGGVFETGFTVTVFRNFQGDAVLSAAKLADSFTSGAKVLDRTQHKAPPLISYGCRVSKDGRTRQLVAIANRRTNTMYALLFEAPDAEFAAAWKAGAPLFQQFLVDEAY